MFCFSGQVDLIAQNDPSHLQGFRAMSSDCINMRSRWIPDPYLECLPEPESPGRGRIPKAQASEPHKFGNPLFAFLSLHERHPVFPLINTSFLVLFQTLQIQSHILMQSLKVGF